MISTYSRISIVLKNLATMTLIASLFPYFTFISTKWDTQPWALLFASLYLLVSISFKRTLHIPWSLRLIIVSIWYGIIITVTLMLFQQINAFIMMRRFFAYLTFALVANVAVNEYKYLPVNWMIFAIFVWLFGAIIQIVVGIHVLRIFIPRISIRPNQGLTSFAPEPSYYAIQMGFLLIFNELLYKESKYGYYMYVFIIIALVIQLIISLSGTALIILIIFLGSKVLLHRININTALIIISVVALIIMLYCYNTTNENNIGFKFIVRSRPVAVVVRFKNLAKANFSMNNIVKDRSITYRIMAPIVNFYGGIIISHGMGFGWGRIAQKNFSSAWTKILGRYKYSGGKPVEEWQWGSTNLGGISSIIYELGIVGLILVIEIYYRAYKTFMLKYISITGLLIFFIITFGGFVSLAHPLLGYIIGVFINKTQQSL